MKKRDIGLIHGLILWCVLCVQIQVGAQEGAFIEPYGESPDESSLSEAAKASLEWTKNGYSGIIAQQLQSGGDTMQMALKNARLAAARSFAAEYMLHPFSPRSMTMRALIFMKQKMAPVREQEIRDIYSG